MNNFLSTLIHGNIVFAISEKEFHLLNQSEVEVARFPTKDVIVGYAECDNQYYIRLPDGTVYTSSNSQFPSFYGIFKDASNKSSHI